MSRKNTRLCPIFKIDMAKAGRASLVSKSVTSSHAQSGFPGSTSKSPVPTSPNDQVLPTSPFILLRFYLFQKNVLTLLQLSEKAFPVQICWKTSSGRHNPARRQEYHRYRATARIFCRGTVRLPPLWNIPFQRLGSLALSGALPCLLFPGKNSRCSMSYIPYMKSCILQARL